MPGRNTNSADNVFMISLCVGLALLIVRVSGQSCGSPGEILNGRFNTDEGVLFGAKAYAVCDEGFQLAGNGVRNCRAAGWDGDIPICEIVRCPNPLEIVNGEITNPPHRTVTFGTVIIYKCNEGVLVGNRELVCTKYGNYSSAPPACKDHNGCRSVQVENGYKTAGFGPDYNYGDFIAFACNPGYILSGTDTVTCGINEIWEPELPACQKAPTTTTTTTTTTTEVPPTPSPGRCGKTCGIILGVFAAVILVILTVLVYCLCFRNKNGKSSSPPGTAAAY
ncbi:membrane cofactor protein-like isoform X2 [Acipenser ruthenus]|uniref:membrane cofactor protein-like isoform X2 n=1 Tax=Acipenser ruthenus TaxID=7906 RepID=UPI0027408FD7|nr:membrane cofactor protein-like isoform X2 [Acipenser ruthenus]